MQRWLRRLAPAIGLVVAVALVIPFAGGLIEALGFRRAGDDVVEELAADDLDAVLGESVLLVAATSCSGGSAITGTAFVVEVAGRTVAVTNAHVVDDVAAVGLRSLQGAAGPRVARWQSASSADVALLELSEPATAPPALPWAADGPRPGQRTRTVGFPFGRPFTTAGDVASVTPDRVVLDLQVDPGASGSPVLDRRGRVVAQVFARTADGRGVGTPVAGVREALADLGPVQHGCAP